MKIGPYIIIIIYATFLVLSMLGIGPQEKKASRIIREKERKIDPYLILTIVYVTLFFLAAIKIGAPRL